MEQHSHVAMLASATAALANYSLKDAGVLLATVEKCTATTTHTKLDNEIARSDKLSSMFDEQPVTMHAL